MLFRSGPFRGGKYSGFEAGTRIPQLVRWPGKIKPAVSNTLVSQIDWYASFANLIGYSIKNNEAPDSRNDLKTLLGKSLKNRECVVEQNLNNVLGIVVDDWKYIEPSKFAKINKDTHTELANDKNPQLYNLKSDPGETTNLAEQYPDKVLELKTKLYKVRNSEK